MPKSNYEKIISLFEKEELGSKILAYDAMRGILGTAIEEKKKELADKLTEFQTIQESIKKQ